MSRPKDDGMTGAVARRIASPVAPRPPSASYSQPNITAASGKTVGANSTGQISAVAPVYKPPSLTAAQWTAQDTTLKHQRDAAHLALQDYIAQRTQQTANYQTEYNRNTQDTQDNQKVDRLSLGDDYASRGMSFSGLGLKAVADQGTDYAKKYSALGAGRGQFLGNAQSAYQNFLKNQQINDVRYRDEAIARRAAAYNLP